MGPLPHGTKFAWMPIDTHDATTKPAKTNCFHNCCPTYAA